MIFDFLMNAKLGSLSLGLSKSEVREGLGLLTLPWESLRFSHAAAGTAPPVVEHQLILSSRSATLNCQN